MRIFEHHVLAIAPGRLDACLQHLDGVGRQRVREAGGRCFGLWKPLIGLSLNHAVILTEWPDMDAALTRRHDILSGLAARDAAIEHHDLWQPTLRPVAGDMPPADPGYVTLRWYDITAEDLDAFLARSAGVWPNHEAAHGTRVIGLWRSLTAPAPGHIRMRLMAWYPDLAAWERSRHWKGTVGAETANSELTKRYAMTRDSAVSVLVQAP